MTVTREQFASEALLAISKPVSVANLQSMVIWAASENTKAENNPYASTLQYEGSTKFNEAGVQNYATLAEGIAAFKETILNGLYGDILGALEHSEPPAVTCSIIENSPWGSKPSSELVNTVLSDFAAYAQTPIGGSAGETAPDENSGVSEPVLKIGIEGSSVKDLQNFLNEDCSAHLEVDGIFGEFTQLAVRNFQRFFGIEVDGIVGPQTWSVIHYVEALHGQPES